MYLFPFEMLEKGSDIVIYGAGTERRWSCVSRSFA
jgi:hypothetical protein